MIVLDIALGVMLTLGWRRKLTAWLFFLIVVFFTLLTGFTFMTGYVPTEAKSRLRRVPTSRPKCV